MGLETFEDYFEQRRAGKIKKEDKFMVLCTQPRWVDCFVFKAFQAILLQNAGKSW